MPKARDLRDVIRVRAGGAGDLEAIAAIQSRCPLAAQWDPADYLAHDLLVATWENRMAGFVVSRTVAPGESEILNLAVDPELRRRGVARALLESVFSNHSGAIFLEVRESNTEALKFYQAIGFQELGRRPEYYSAPPEAAIVLKFHSC